MNKLLSTTSCLALLVCFAAAPSAVMADSFATPPNLATPQALTGGQSGFVAVGSNVTVVGDDAVTWNGSAGLVTLTNNGTIQATDGRAFDTSGAGGADRSLLLTNSGTITADDDAVRVNFATGSVVVNNSGTIRSSGDGQALDLNGATNVTVNNLAGGVIEAVDADGVRAGDGGLVDNAGTISSGLLTDDSNDGVDFQDFGGTVVNRGTGVIDGGRHGITGDGFLDITNEEGGVIRGLNGAGVNGDGAGKVVNYGTISGNYNPDLLGPGVEPEGVDGDGVDIDGVGEIDNYGTIAANGAFGTNDGDPNTADGIAMGGGIINNHAGGKIISVERGILIDDSSNGPALGATHLTNAGSIESAEAAVTFVGNLDDTIENSGSIVAESGPAVDMGGGSDTLTNSGTIQSKDGRAVDFGGEDGAYTVLIDNKASGVIESTNDAVRIDYDLLAGGSVTLHNSGTIHSDEGQAIDFNGLESAGSEILIVNHEGGIISADDADAIRPGNGGLVDNAGTISSGLLTDDSNDGIDFQDFGGTVINRGTGVIDGGRHGITGDGFLDITNEAGGVIRGLNGAGVNGDGEGRVVNYGTISGNYNPDLLGPGVEPEGVDGDGVDIDGVGEIDNYGTIAGNGAFGTNDGDPNTADGIAMGGGRIVNHDGASITSVDRGILIDDSSGGAALGATEIENAGSIHAVNDAITLVGDWDDVIENSGSIVSDLGTAVDMGGGNDVLLQLEGSSVGGGLLGGAGEDLLQFVGMVGGLPDTVEGWEFVILSAGTELDVHEATASLTLTGTDYLLIDDTSTLIAAGQSPGVLDIPGSVGNLGTLSLHDFEADDLVNIGGDYAGNGAVIAIDAALDGSEQGDLVSIGGDVGDVVAVLPPPFDATLTTTNTSTGVEVYDIGDGIGAWTGQGAGDGIAVIAVGGTTQASDFFLVDGATGLAGPIQVGVFDYDLNLEGDNTWYLQSLLLDQAYAYGALPAAMLQIQQSLMGSLYERLGDRKQLAGGAQLNEPADSITGLGGYTAVWLRGVGAFSQTDGDFTVGDSEVSSSFDQTTALAQLGMDLQVYADEMGSAVVGISGIYGQSWLHADDYQGVEVSNWNTDVYGLQLTGTWYGSNGLYVDTGFQALWYSGEVKGEGVVGGGGDKADVDGFGYGVGAEVGYAYQATRHLEIVPNARLNYADVTFDDFTDSDGVDVSISDGQSLEGRIGVMVEASMRPGRGTWFSAYVEGNIVHEFLGDSTVEASGTELGYDLKGTAAEVGLGASVRVVTNVSLYGQVDYQIPFDSDNGTKTLQTTGGVRVSF